MFTGEQFSNGLRRGSGNRRGVGEPFKVEESRSGNWEEKTEWAGHVFAFNKVLSVMFLR